MLQAALERTINGVIVEGDLKISWPNGKITRHGNGRGLAAHLVISDAGLIPRMLRNPELTLGEGYMEGGLRIEDDDLHSFLRLVARNARKFGAGRFSAAAAGARTALRRIAQHNPIHIAKRNVEVHYDLSTDLYELFLDPAMQYTCGYYKKPGMSLAEAQQAKMRHIGEKLMIEPDMRVMDIGCGWGGLSIALARDFGARVTGVSLSKVQLAYAREKAEAAGVADRIDFRLVDYRDVDELFDRIVVVGMMEHVGQPQYAQFIQQLEKNLSPNGISLVHTIGRTTPPGQTSPFINKYIFPGGYAPAMSEVMAEVEKTSLMPMDIEVWRTHYAQTLIHWQEKFEANVDAVRALYDDKFVRMWRYYLVASEMSFSELGLVIFQFQMAHQEAAVPVTREYLYGGSTAGNRPQLVDDGGLEPAVAAQLLERVGT
ncbi:MAG: class I SAM-dependent methyltransferase [Maritimibacter sp.]